VRETDWIILTDILWCGTVWQGEVNMYNPRIEPDKIERLYKLKQGLLTRGQKTNMVKLVDEALEKYLAEKEKELFNGR
jgi:hypothetical protein